MALCSEPTDQSAQKVLDGVDIVRDAIYQQLRCADAHSDPQLVPLAMNLLKEMEPPTPTESAAPTLHKNDGLSLLAVEAHWRQTDV
jgi:hypothetical protein